MNYTDSPVADTSDLERLQANVAAAPDDPAARAALAAALDTAGRPRDAAVEYLQAGFAARRSGDQDAYRGFLRTALGRWPDVPLLFTCEPTAALAPTPASILVAHPDPAVRDGLTAALGLAGHQTWSAATAAATTSATAAPDVILCGPGFPDGDAATVLANLSRRYPRATRLLLTCAARGEPLPPPTVLAPWVDEHLDRPLDPTRLLAAIDAAIFRRDHAVALPAPATGSPAANSPATGKPILGQGADWPRAALVLVAGYALILSTHVLIDQQAVELLQQARGEIAARERFGAVAATDEPTLATGELELGRQRVVARLLAQPGATPEALGLIRLEVQVESGASDLDPAAIAASLRLLTATGPVAPVGPPWFSDVALAPGTATRIEQTTLIASFDPATLAAPSDPVLELELGGQRHQVRLAIRRGGDPAHAPH